MCLTNRCPADIEEIEAFKIFSIRSGKLQSAFISVQIYNPDLYYEPNTRIRVADPTSHFFAFAKWKEALNVAIDRDSIWGFASKQLIVLPVTLYNIRYTGDFFVDSGDSQCLNGYYRSFESKEIVVHDNEKNRKAFHKAILDDLLAGVRLKPLQKEAINFFWSQDDKVD